MWVVWHEGLVTRQRTVFCVFLCKLRGKVAVFIRVPGTPAVGPGPDSTCPLFGVDTGVPAPVGAGGVEAGVCLRDYSLLLPFVYQSWDDRGFPPEPVPPGVTSD